MADRGTRIGRPWMEAILWSAAMSTLFVLVYGGCNALAAQRVDIGTLFYAWEMRIPFVPAMIVPYMSSDLLFVVAFVLCRDSIELRVLTRRILAALLVASAMFLAFPLTTGYPRPEVSGWTGWLFERLWSFDKPHNLVPSLHVALASLLWPVYARHTRGALRWIVHLWFGMLIASTLLTWQHHVVDVATGALLGQLCIFAFPEPGERSLRRSAKGNLRVAALYAGGGVALAVWAVTLGAWFWLLLWPAASLACIAFAYIRGDSSVFRKTKGRLPLSTRVVLGPYLLGAAVRVQVYRWRRAPWVEIAPGIYSGRLLSRREAEDLNRLGVGAVVDLTAEHAETKNFRRCEYLNIPVLDLTPPSQEQLEAAATFIAEHACREAVYVHCALGISRSVSAIAAYNKMQGEESLRSEPGRRESRPALGNPRLQPSRGSASP